MCRGGLSCGERAASRGNTPPKPSRPAATTISSCRPASRPRSAGSTGPTTTRQFESEAVPRMAFAEHGQTDAALETLAALREQAEEKGRFVTEIARSYVEGRGLYPDRVHTVSLVNRFFADYFALLESWAAWA